MTTGNIFPVELSKWKTFTCFPVVSERHGVVVVPMTHPQAVLGNSGHKSMTRHLPGPTLKGNILEPQPAASKPDLTNGSEPCQTAEVSLLSRINEG